MNVLKARALSLQGKCLCLCLVVRCEFEKYLSEQNLRGTFNMRCLSTLLVGAIFSVSAQSAFAVGCTENVTNVITHSNVQIYFQTDKTCTAWCQINWGSDPANKNAYAMMLTARTAGKPLFFSWPSLANCTTSNPTYALPEYMGYAG